MPIYRPHTIQRGSIVFSGAGLFATQSIIPVADVLRSEVTPLGMSMDSVSALPLVRPNHLVRLSLPSTSQVRADRARGRDTNSNAVNGSVSFQVVEWL